ncbi:MAG: hypothetical protein LBU32_05080 [Clostridiales bacterium]|nr:hypothetical protein [Clostridiales bacterium]
MPNANRKYKDSVFTSLFSDKGRLLELYNAIEGGGYPAGTEIDINTLEGVLYLDQLNDISFTIGDKIVVIIEHQTTINNNMPLRSLIYISRVYEKIIDNKETYRQKLLKIPTPEFIVLYNGVAPYPDEKTLKLSDAFKSLPANSGTPLLELIVRVLNVNPGHNPDVLQKCGTLKEYTTFVAKVREFLEAGSKLDSAIAEAIKWCLENGVLHDYLKLHGSEVVNMLLTEFNLEDALSVRYEEGREEGIEEGREEGREEGTKNVAKEMLADGEPFEKIVRYTKLPLEEIHALKGDYGS